MKKVKLILLILWMIIIFLASHDSGEVSSSKSDSVSKFIISIIEDIRGEKFNTSEIEDFTDNTVFYIRKSAHFIEYLILGILIISILSDYSYDKKIVIFSFIFCLLYAITDEIHQLFISGRSAKVMDVIIDSSGSITGIFIYYLLVVKRKIKIKYNKKA